MSGTWNSASVIHCNQPDIFKRLTRRTRKPASSLRIWPVHQCRRKNHNKIFFVFFLTTPNNHSIFHNEGARRETVPTTILTCKKQQHQKRKGTCALKPSTSPGLERMECISKIHHDVGGGLIKTFNLANNDGLNQSFAKFSVRYVFLSLLVQKMQRRAKQCKQNEMNNTLQTLYNS